MNDTAAAVVLRKMNPFQGKDGVIHYRVTPSLFCMGLQGRTELDGVNISFSVDATRSRMIEWNHFLPAPLFSA